MGYYNNFTANSERCSVGLVYFKEKEPFIYYLYFHVLKYRINVNMFN